jgi:hypothetical protein
MAHDVASLTANDVRTISKQKQHLHKILLNTMRRCVAVVAARVNRAGMNRKRLKLTWWDWATVAAKVGTGVGTFLGGLAAFISAMSLLLHYTK